VVSHHLGGFLLSDRAGLFHPAPDPGVHRVSLRRETKIPAALVLPSEAFPPSTATSPARVRTRGRASRSSHRWLSLHRSPCPLTLSLRKWEDGFPFPDGVSPVSLRSRGLRALLHRRVRCRPARFRSRLPGAPLGLTDPAVASSQNFSRSLRVRRPGPPLSGGIRTCLSSLALRLAVPGPSRGTSCRTWFVRQRPLREAALGLISVTIHLPEGSWYCQVHHPQAINLQI
jgi:hypothetical protein